MRPEEIEKQINPLPWQLEQQSIGRCNPMIAACSSRLLSRDVSLLSNRSNPSQTSQRKRVGVEPEASITVGADKSAANSFASWPVHSSLNDSLEQVSSGDDE